jgi:hypothetical protein
MDKYWNGRMGDETSRKVIALKMIQWLFDLN